ncbi:MAG: hypothetical protein HXS52_06470 [Theionarchaea archaeon]|nr:hypothetical protein [Theionarchaea archaeon]MBU7037557.1 hypothetical protein [Theionarchaea archaeon]
MNEFLMISYEIGKQKMQELQKEAENWRLAQSIKNCKQKDDTCQTTTGSGSTMLQKTRALKV